MRSAWSIRPATVQVALGELGAADLVASAGEDGQQRWVPLSTARDPLLDAVDLHGSRLRHTVATWLEDAGIPAHTTPDMAARIATAIEQRLRLVLEVAEQTLEAHPAAQRPERSGGHEPRFLANL